MEWVSSPKLGIILPSSHSSGIEQHGWWYFGLLVSLEEKFENLGFVPFWHCSMGIGRMAGFAVVVIFEGNRSERMQFYDSILAEIMNEDHFLSVFKSKFTLSYEIEKIHQVITLGVGNFPIVRTSIPVSYSSEEKDHALSFYLLSPYFSTEMGGTKPRHYEK